MEREGVLNMTQDYISYIRSKVGHDKVILTFAGGILTDKDGRVLLQLRGDKKTWAIPGGEYVIIMIGANTLLNQRFERSTTYQ